MPLAPRDFEVRFGTSGSAPGLKEGLKLDGFAVSGTIDRIDRDPAMSARGVIWDYKSGREVHSAADIENDWRLQIPLYILAVRELVGVEPVAGLYRALAGERAGPRHGRRRRGRDAVPATTSWTKRCSGGGSSWRSSGRTRSSGGCAPATFATIRARGRARTGAGGATPGSAGWRRERARLERGPAAGDRTAGLRVRVGGRGHRQDGGAGRARGAAGAGGDAARPPAGDHVHGAGGGRAQGPSPQTPARGRTRGRRGGPSTRPGSRRSTGSAAACSAPTRWMPASTRPSACRPRRRR